MFSNLEKTFENLAQDLERKYTQIGMEKGFERGVEQGIEQTAAFAEARPADRVGCGSDRTVRAAGTEAFG